MKVAAELRKTYVKVAGSFHLVAGLEVHSPVLVKFVLLYWLCTSINRLSAFSSVDFC